MKVPVMVPSSQWHWCRPEKPTAGMVKKQSQDFFPFFFGIYNVEMHQNLYPFQSSMDAQRILCKRFQLVGFQSTGQNRQISALSRFSIAKKRNWTLGRFFFFEDIPKQNPAKLPEAFTAFRHLRELCWEMLRKGLVSKVDRKLGDWWEEVFSFVCFQDCLIHPTGPYPGIRIPIHPHQISEWILTQWWYNLHFL